MPSNVILKALGLNISPNQLEVQEGSLTEAKNIIIQRDNIIEPRRGFKLYDESFGTLTDRAKQLMTYQKRLIRHWANTLSFDTGTVNTDGEAVFQDFAGSFTEPVTGRRIRSIEANQNLYFTSLEGVQKISASSAVGLSGAAGFITQAGGIKAIDLQTRLKITPGAQTGFFTQDSAVAYRVVWGIKDANTNLILGTPSQRAEIYNPLINLLLGDYMRVLGGLDDIAAGVSANTNLPGTLIDNKDYVNSLKLPNTASASQLYTNLLSLATKLDNDIKYADDITNAPLQLGASSATIATGVCTITFSSGDPSDYFVIGSKIFLSGYTPTTGQINGAQIVTFVNSTTIQFNTTAIGPVAQSSPTIVSNEYRGITPPTAPSTPATNQQLVDLQTYLDNIIQRLQSEPVDVISTLLSDAYIIPLSITSSATVILDITIPQGVTLSNFFQIYRSAVTEATGTAVLSTDIFPSDELQLVYEAFPTQADLDAGFVEVEDIVLDSFRGANLYTNAQSGEGILQANDVPPFCLDINRFKNALFYANTKTRHRNNISLLGINNMIADYDNSIIPKVLIANDLKSNTYDFVTGLEEITDVACNAGSTLNATGNGSYFLINSAENFNKYYVWYQIGTSVDPMVAGRIGIMVLADAGDTDVEIAEKTTDVINRYIYDFGAVSSTNTVTISTTEDGYTDDSIDGDTGFIITVAQDGRGEKISKEITELDCGAGSLLNSSGTGDYFLLGNVFNRNPYYVWYQIGTATDPMIAGHIGIQVSALTTDNATQIATKTAAAIALVDDVFDATANSTTVTITLIHAGPANDATIGSLPVGFTISTIQQGALEVLLSSEVSSARAVDETARSFIRIINKNTDEAVYGYYLSGAQDVPGKMLLEGRILDLNPFYVLGNNLNTGASFSPDISPEHFISAISAASPTQITSNNHGLVSGDQIVIDASDSEPNIDGLWTVTVTGVNTFTIPVEVITPGTTGAFIKAVEAVVSENENKPHRVYFSKILQPEAVPIVNWLDIGSENKAILRIFPLRDSLFVFKEDGLWRISGENPPYNVSLFDSSCILISADSLDVSNNLLYGWTRQGIVSVSESGVNIISRPIDNEILKLGSSIYENFASATWGIGYESDNSYLVWTVQETNDTVGTFCYRYSTLTQSWTNYDKPNTCGIINPADDKLYLGAADINNLEQERKSFTRLDYADREIKTALVTNNQQTIGSQNLYLLKVTDIGAIQAGDVVTQEQLLTIYEYNSLLQKLDVDPGVGDSDYLETLEAKNGDDLRKKLVDSIIGLAPKLDADPGLQFTNYASSIAPQTGSILSISATGPAIIETPTPHGLQDGRVIIIAGSDSTPSIDGAWVVEVIDSTHFSINITTITTGTTGTWATQDNDFRDIQACFNFIITHLNNDLGTVFKNYTQSLSTTLQEAVIQSVNSSTNVITLNVPLPFVIGPMTLFSAIRSTFTYAPNIMGNDPLSFKHFREAELYFDSKAFSFATVSFATDLFPAFVDVVVTALGNGIFGFKDFGEGFFGGIGNSVPFRTYLPRNSQRGRFIVMKFTHRVAREKYLYYGYSITGQIGTSTRTYRR